MARTYDAQSLIELPTLDAGSASALIAAVLQEATAAGRRLSPAVVASRDALALAGTNLGTALRLALPTGDEGGTVADPERAEATAWTACEKWLDGLMSNPTHNARTALAASLHQKLFAGGVGFVRGKSHKRWAATEARLQLVQTDGLSAQFNTLGGADMLAAIETTHRATGKALGFTAALAPAPSPQLRDCLDEAKAALRDYILQVVAFGAANAGSQQELATELLKPLSSYEPPPRAKSSKQSGESGASGSGANGSGKTAAPAAGDEAAAEGAKASEKAAVEKVDEPSAPKAP